MQSHGALTGTRRLSIARATFASALVSALVLACFSGTALAKRKRGHQSAGQPAAAATEAEEAPPAPTPPAPVAAQPEPVKEAPKPPPPVTPPPTEERAPAAAMSSSRAPEAVARARASEPPIAGASRVGAHVGVASPLVTYHTSNAVKRFSSVNDDFTLIAPLGLGVRLGDGWAFDFEIQVATGVRPEGLTTLIIDPGIIHNWDRVGAGVRVAWQLNVNQNVGLIPLFNVALVRSEKATWFVEAAAPSFVQNKNLTVSGSLQTGVGF